MMDTPKLLVDSGTFKSKLDKVKAWIFDWDGIFNDGQKDHQRNSSFNERDSMGTNMLRYAHYLRSGELPYCAVITGASNETSRVLAEREHFHAIVPGAKYKWDVLQILLAKWDVKPSETAFFFDDIIDLNVCEHVGLRVQVRYPSSSSMNDYIDQHQLADVVTYTSGNQQAVRELCDYFINEWDLTAETIHGRMHFSEKYQAYWSQRQRIDTMVFSRDEMLEQHNKSQSE